MVASSPRGQTLPRLRRNGHAEPVTTENHGNSGQVPRALRTMAPAVVDRAFCDALTEAERLVCGKPKNRHVSPLPDEFDRPLGNLMLAVGRMAAYRPTVQADTAIAKVGFGA
jgi:hypothetical protein